ncbi:MAG: hypothetical protein LAT64_07920 [Phycisphaerales bacterium]|nr:hypothetical protein [Planctomycetota bacterium]MCH8508681.1 hypothetical protein [Phycisphaerales bacterium]
MILQTKKEILAARSQLPNGVLQDASDLISQHLLSNPSQYPECRDEAIHLVASAVCAAKANRIGRDLTLDEMRSLLRDSEPFAERVLIIGVSSAAWTLRASGNVKTGAKWAGRAALVGVGALLGFSIG